MVNVKKIPLNKKLLVGGVILVGGLLVGLSQFGAQGLEGRVSQTTKTPLPELIVQSISSDSTTGLLSVTVANKGKADVSSDFVTTGVTAVYIDDMTTPVYNYSWSTLSDLAFMKAGGSSVLSPGSLTAGSHKVKACVDATNVVKELLDNNNCSPETSLTFTPPLPDLTVTDAVLSSQNELTVTLTNKGTADVPAGSLGFTTVYVDGSARWQFSWADVSDVSFMTVGGSSTLKTRKMFFGTHTFKACVDSTSVVAESDENNNCSPEVSLTSSESEDSSGDTTTDGTTVDSGTDTTGTDEATDDGTDVDTSQDQSDDQGDGNSTEPTYYSQEDNY